MDMATCFHLLREIKSLSFATVDHAGNPQVRIIDLMLVEKDTLYFLTARGKNFYKELMDTKRVAVVGLTKNYEMIRVSGIVEKLSDQQYWIDRMFKENVSMNDVYPGKSRYILEPFCIHDAQVEYFDLSRQPIYRETFTIENHIKHKKGFMISDKCIACGKCANKCPQHCIQAGTPYHILQQHCLHCGLCYEICPMKAIHKQT